MSVRGWPRPQWLGRLGYRWAWRLQHLRRNAVLRGEAPPAFWLLEHDPVVTLGRRAVPDLPGERLAAAGIPTVVTERGGLATYHGPGQLVGYLILNLDSAQLSVRGLVWGMEEGLIQWLAKEGVHAFRARGRPGVWTAAGKIGAVGLHVRRYVSMHGFALNLDPDLSSFGLFAPCGLAGDQVVSLRQLTKSAPPAYRVARSVGASVLEAVRRAR